MSNEPREFWVVAVRDIKTFYVVYESLERLAGNYGTTVDELPNVEDLEIIHVIEARDE